MTLELEIICVGNELLIGKTLNTNAHWIGKQATNLGANVKRLTVVQDIVDEIATIICETLERKPQLIITTGGLGPTFDDKTLEGIAKALNRKLEINPKALAMVKQKCAEYAQKRNMPDMVEMTPQRTKMAKIPEKTDPVQNPIGSAPGIKVKVKDTLIFALPGVPTEMEAIFTQTIEPLIKQLAGDNLFFEKSLFVDGMPESNLAPLIDKVMADVQGVYIKSHVYVPTRNVITKNRPHIEVHLTIRTQQKEKPMEKLACAIKQLSSLVDANGGTPSPSD